MSADEQVLALGFAELVAQVTPQLTVRTWYGMPAYATPGSTGSVVCFFQSGSRMRTRYCSVGFSDAARLDDGTLWPTALAVTARDDSTRDALAAQLQRALG